MNHLVDIDVSLIKNAQIDWFVYKSNICFPILLHKSISTKFFRRRLFCCSKCKFPTLDFYSQIFQGNHLSTINQLSHKRMDFLAFVIRRNNKLLPDRFSPLFIETILSSHIKIFRRQKRWILIFCLFSLHEYTLHQNIIHSRFELDIKNSEEERAPIASLDNRIDQGLFDLLSFHVLILCPMIFFEIFYKLPNSFSSFKLPLCLNSPKKFIFVLQKFYRKTIENFIWTHLKGVFQSKIFPMA